MYRALPAMQNDVTPCKRLREMGLIGGYSYFQIELRSTCQRSLLVNEPQASGDDGAQNDSSTSIGVSPHSLFVNVLYLFHQMGLQTKRYVYPFVFLLNTVRFTLSVIESRSKNPMVFLKLTLRTLHPKYLNAIPQVQLCALGLPMGLGVYSAVVLLA